MSAVAAVTGRLRDELQRTRLSLELLVERRWLAVVIVDLALVLGMAMAALSNNGEPQAVYFNVVQLPLVVLGVPLLANGLALERRSGSLELLLASPAGHATLVRRYASLCAVLFLQGALVLAALWLTPSRPFPLPMVLFQTAVAAALLGAVTLFWCLYLRSSGAAMLASAVTLVLLTPWFFDNPIPIPDEPTGRFMYSQSGALRWLRVNTVLLVATAIFYLYARRRLSRSEKLLV